MGLLSPQRFDQCRQRGVAFSHLLEGLRFEHHQVAVAHGAYRGFCEGASEERRLPKGIKVVELAQHRVARRNAQLHGIDIRAVCIDHQLVTCRQEGHRVVQEGQASSWLAWRQVRILCTEEVSISECPLYGWRAGRRWLDGAGGRQAVDGTGGHWREVRVKRRRG